MKVIGSLFLAGVAAQNQAAPTELTKNFVKSCSKFRFKRKDLPQNGKFFMFFS